MDDLGYTFLHHFVKQCQHDVQVVEVLKSCRLKLSMFVVVFASLSKEFIVIIASLNPGVHMGICEGSSDV